MPVLEEVLGRNIHVSMAARHVLMEESVDVDILGVLLAMQTLVVLE